MLVMLVQSSWLDVSCFISSCCHFLDCFGHWLFVVAACFEEHEGSAEIQVWYNGPFSYVFQLGYGLQRRFLDMQLFICAGYECILLSSSNCFIVFECFDFCFWQI